MRERTLLEKVDWREDPEVLEALEADVVCILRTKTDAERVESVLACIREGVVPVYLESFGCKDIDALGFGELEVITEMVRRILAHFISGFIEDSHRAFIVRLHARNVSTSTAVYHLIETDAVMARLAESTALGEEMLHSLLVHRLAYLKAGSNRWPQKKFGKIWQEERQAYKNTLHNSDLPLTDPQEHIMLISRELVRISNKLDTDNYDVKEHATLTATLLKLVNQLNTLYGSSRRVPTQLDDEHVRELAAYVVEMLTGMDRDKLSRFVEDENMPIALPDPSHTSE